MSVGPFNFSGFCGGTLIDRKTILTAASCIRRSVNFNYNGSNYTDNIYSNSFYPTTASQYKIYLGLQNKSSIINNSAALSFNVSQIIMVKKIFFIKKFV